MSRLTCIDGSTSWTDWRGLFSSIVALVKAKFQEKELLTVKWVKVVELFVYENMNYSWSKSQNYLEIRSQHLDCTDFGIFSYIKFIHKILHKLLFVNLVGRYYLLSLPFIVVAHEVKRKKPSTEVLNYWCHSENVLTGKLMTPFKKKINTLIM